MIMRGYTEYGEIVRYRDAQKHEVAKARKAGFAARCGWGDPEAEAYQFHFNDCVWDEGEPASETIHPEKREKKSRRRA